MNDAIAELAREAQAIAAMRQQPQQPKPAQGIDRLRGHVADLKNEASAGLAQLFQGGKQ